MQENTEEKNVARMKLEKFQDVIMKQHRFRCMRVWIWAWWMAEGLGAGMLGLNYQ